MFAETKMSTNMGLLLVLVLMSYGRILDETSPSFFAAAQMESTGVAGTGSTAEAPSPSAPVSAPTPAAECPLDCANGAECKIGEHNFRFHPKEPNGATLTFLQTTNRDGWFCDCPMGFTGLRCTRPYEICPLPVGVEAGEEEIHFCYHGGKCIDGLGDTVDSSEHFCDCSSAQHNGVPYYGKYCEIEGAIRCSDDSQQYCTAQGTCKEDFDTKFYPCDCQVGHRGPHCEYLRGSVPECTLPCDGTIEGNSFKGGNGYCRLGIKDFDNARYKDFWAEHDGNYQYCVSRTRKKRGRFLRAFQSSRLRFFSHLVLTTFFHAISIALFFFGLLRLIVLSRRLVRRQLRDTRNPVWKRPLLQRWVLSREPQQ